MDKKPKLEIGLNENVFKEYYYLKEELVEFCRQNGLQTTGNKIELSERVYEFLKTGKKVSNPVASKKNSNSEVISLESIIEDNFVCSEKTRAFFESQIGSSFKFYVPFQKWLKKNAGKTYNDAIKEYKQLLKNKDNKAIDKQFEYNTYIRDFFVDNKDKSFNQAVCCWNYKKNLKGSHKYEHSDLIALNK